MSTLSGDYIQHRRSKLMKVAIITTILSLTVAALGYTVYAKNQMHKEIEGMLKEFSAGGFDEIKLVASGPKCVLPCESKFQDLEFHVYGPNECNVYHVSTYESFPKYEVLSVEHVSLNCTDQKFDDSNDPDND